MEKDISKEGRESLDRIEKGIAGIDGLMIDDEVLKELHQSIALLRRAYDFCDTNLFVLTCVGMLKAGKSTLVSLMAGNKEASPTGFGVDTTMRPALIVSAGEESAGGRIDVWKSSDLKDNDRDETQSKQDEFEGILLCECKGGRPHEHYELNAANLKRALCDKKEVDEPVLVVVRVPQRDGSILARSKVVILDTPGLDSAKSIWTSQEKDADLEKPDGRKEENRYRWILDATDMAVFIQSSVSALNSNATKVLSNLKEEKKVTWLVHNEMRGKYWRTDESVKPEESLQIADAVGVFQDAGFDREKVCPLRINLGKAYDAMPGFAKSDEFKPEYNPANLKQESGIDQFENRLNDFLRENGDRVRREHCIGLVGKRVDNLQVAINAGMESLRKKIDNQMRGREELRAICSMIKEEVSRQLWGEFQRVEMRPCRIVDGLFNERFVEHEYDRGDIQRALHCIRNGLCGQFKDELDKGLDERVRVVSGDTSDGIILNDFVQGVFDRLYAIAKALKLDDAWRKRIEDITGELLTLETKRDLISLCRKELSGLNLECDVVDIDDAISRAVRSIKEAGHHKLKTLWFKKYYTRTEAMDISEVCRMVFKKWEEGWTEKVKDVIAVWLRKELPVELCLRFDQRLGAIVDEEVKNIEGVCDNVRQQIKSIKSLADGIEHLKIKGA